LPWRNGAVASANVDRSFGGGLLSPRWPKGVITESERVRWHFSQSRHVEYTTAGHSQEFSRFGRIYKGLNHRFISILIRFRSVPSQNLHSLEIWIAENRLERMACKVSELILKT
jgi:hypothetical protein